MAERGDEEEVEKLGAGGNAETMFGCDLTSRNILNSLPFRLSRNMDDSNAPGGKKRKGGNAGLDFRDPDREAKKQSRAARFQKQLRSEPLVLSVNQLDMPDGTQEGLSWEDCPIVGTCQDITKCYLRLTCAPDPATVRPIHVSRHLLWDTLKGTHCFR